jgi:hypothetical protein
MKSEEHDGHRRRGKGSTLHGRAAAAADWHKKTARTTVS